MGVLGAISHGAGVVTTAALVLRAVLRVKRRVGLGLRRGFLDLAVGARRGCRRWHRVRRTNRHLLYDGRDQVLGDRRRRQRTTLLRFIGVLPLTPILREPIGGAQEHGGPSQVFRIGEENFDRHRERYRQKRSDRAPEPSPEDHGEEDHER